MPLSLLYVDDDSGSLRIVSMLLKSRGINVDTAEAGDVAFNLFLINYYNVVLMDYFMPNMNGAEVAIGIKDIDSFKIPIYAVTGNMSLICEDDIAIFDDIIDKKELLKFISNLVKEYQ